MQFELTNQTRTLLIVTLSSGKSLHLAPGQTSDPVDYMEVAGDAKIEKLRQTGILSMASH